LDRDRSRTFVFTGAQYSNLDDVVTVGINMHLGSTFFNNRVDFAFTFGLLGADSSLSLNLGLLGRILFPVNQTFGFHIGSQVLMSLTTVSAQAVAGQTTDTTFSTDVTVSALAGVNFFLTQKTSLCVSGVYDSNKSTSLLMGLTHFVNL